MVEKVEAVEPRGRLGSRGWRLRCDWGRRATIDAASSEGRWRVRTTERAAYTKSSEGSNLHVRHLTNRLGGLPGLRVHNEFEDYPFALETFKESLSVRGLDLSA